jgi:DNA-binding response OmpR family regulator
MKKLLPRHQLGHVPTAFASGRSCLEDQQRGLDVGAADYITKPFATFEFAPRLPNEQLSKLLNH